PGELRRARCFFSPAVHSAAEALSKAGKDASHLSGDTWHSNRHTFASLLVMAGVNLRAVQELSGWPAVNLAGPYSHLGTRVSHGCDGATGCREGAVQLSRN